MKNCKFNEGIAGGIKFQRAQSILELALLLPLLLLLFIAAIEIGFLFYNWQKVEGAARAAALYAARGYNFKVAKEKAENNLNSLKNTLLLKNAWLSNDKIEINAYREEGGKLQLLPEGEILIPGDEIEVKINYGALLNIPFWGEIWKLPLVGIAKVVFQTSHTFKGEDIVVKGVLPIGLLHNTYIPGLNYELKPNAPGLYCGNYGCLRLGGAGANVYLHNLIYGYNEDLKINDEVATEPGNMAGPTYEGITKRLNKCHFNCSYFNLKHECPRAVIIPFVNKLPRGSSELIKIVGFGCFFLEEVSTNGEIKATFLYQL
jgi:uncharacterized protein (UPF0333 family)